MKQLSQIYLISLLIITVSGCSGIRYYTQAAGGQMTLLMDARPIPAVVRDPATDDELRQALITAVEVREFAREHLALPVAGSFREFVALERPHVVVNLVAVPEFSLQPHQWCYPVVGCQSYRGYFDLQLARAEQRRFEALGYDTLLAGVSAYSTLGWFDDPLHTGFTTLPPDRMAALIIHELSHQVVYVGGDTAFNESYATAVELEGLRLWLQIRGEPEDFAKAMARLEYREQTLALVESALPKLRALYQQQADLPVAELRARKQALLDQLREDYLALARSWPVPGPFGAALEALSNAHLALFRQYHQYVPGFRQLLRDHDHDFGRFHRAVRALAKQPAERRSAALVALGQRFDEHL
ncbi:MAG: aminopeptidase [Marinobacter sp.]|uniref:aminopeptidase n=1 Tax=Marinobacter sp. TaxID=50741 RepID=UPI00299D2805|nr:aminopeptidase [Marinobacter sp.]MDX1633545.1 aminopeptidase [Marinobacter sp.]